VIRVEAEGRIYLYGTLSANSQDKPPVGTGGGSGGGIYVSCRKFVGATSGVIRANGGGGSVDVRYRTGGGGRIAVWRIYMLGEMVSATASRGVGGDQENPLSTDGTVVWGQLTPPPCGTIFTLH
jgi:hypothetical protein